MKMRVGHKCVVDASVKLRIEIKPGACKDPKDRNDKKIQTGGETAMFEPVNSWNNILNILNVEIINKTVIIEWNAIPIKRKFDV